MGWNEPGGGKDPWGKTPGGGQPDFDQLLKKLRQRFGGSPQTTPRGIAMLLVLAISVWVLSGVYAVAPAERGVVLQLGSFYGITEQGLHWHLPYPIQSVRKINVEQVQSFTDHQTMLTQDQNILIIDWSVEYRIGDIKSFLFKSRKPEESLRVAARSALRDTVGVSKVDDVYYDGRAKIAADAQNNLKGMFNAGNSGIEVTAFKLLDVQAPQSAMAAFAEVTRAREEEKTKQYDAQTYASTILPQAQGEAARQIQQAEGYRASVTERAKGDAARFLALLAEYQKAPQVTRKRLYLDAMESVLTRTTKVVVDTRQGSPAVYLPLDQLMKQSAAASSTQTAKPDNAQPQVAAPVTGKIESRSTTPENLRSRERTQ